MGRDWRAAYAEVLGIEIEEGQEKISTKCIGHDDKHDSLSLNLKTGRWKCFAGCGGGTFAKFKSMCGKNAAQPAAVEPERSSARVSEELIERWHHELLKQKSRRRMLEKQRGWSRTIIERHKIGWDGERFMIPIRSASGQCVLVRRYEPGGRPKMLPWGEGQGLHLFPLSALYEQGDVPVLLCEGEPDALCALSHGMIAVTSTGGADAWEADWSREFAGRDVVIAYDNDSPGRGGGWKISRALATTAKTVRNIVWPTSFAEGGDVTDFLETSTPEALFALSSDPVDPIPTGVDLMADPVSMVYMRTSKGDSASLPVTSFILRPTLYIEDEDGGPERVRVEWLSRGDEEPSVSVLNNDFFASARDLKRALPKMRYQFLGSERDLQAIRALLAQSEAPRRTGLKYAGRIERGDRPMYVLPQGTLDADGWNEEAKWVYAPEDPRDLLTTSFKFGPLELAEGGVKELAGLLADNLVHLHAPRAIVPMLGWIMACPFAEQIREAGGGFPLLNVYGTQNTGKSETFSIFLRMFGWDYGRAEMQTTGHTQFVLLRLLSITSILPIAFDEWRATDQQTVLRRKLLREIYSGGYNDRGRPDQTVTSYRLRAPVALVGETSPEDPATRERTVAANVPPSDPEGEKILNRLHAAQLRGWLLPYLRWTLRDFDFEKRWKLSIEMAAQYTRRLITDPKSNVPTRVRVSVATVLFGLGCVRDYWESLGVDVSMYSADWERRGIEAMLKALVPITGVRGKVGLDSVLQTLSSMSEAGQLAEGQEWCRGPSPDQILIRLRVCVAKYLAWVVRSEPATEPLTFASYERMAEENEAKGGYVTKAAWAYRGRRWLSISESRAERVGLDLGGFRIHGGTGAENEEAEDPSDA